MAHGIHSNVWQVLSTIKVLPTIHQERYLSVSYVPNTITALKGQMIDTAIHAPEVPIVLEDQMHLFFAHLANIACRKLLIS
jgi:hypothetical protein